MFCRRLPEGSFWSGCYFSQQISAMIFPVYLLILYSNSSWIERKLQVVIFSADQTTCCSFLQESTDAECSRQLSQMRGWTQLSQYRVELNLYCLGRWHFFSYCKRNIIAYAVVSMWWWWCAYPSWLTVFKNLNDSTRMTDIPPLVSIWNHPH